MYTNGHWVPGTVLEDYSHTHTTKYLTLLTNRIRDSQLKMKQKLDNLRNDYNRLLKRKKVASSSGMCVTVCICSMYVCMYVCMYYYVYYVCMYVYYHEHIHKHETNCKFIIIFIASSFKVIQSKHEMKDVSVQYTCLEPLIGTPLTTQPPSP